MTSLLTLVRMLTGFIIAKVIAIHTGPTGLAILGQFQSFLSSLTGIFNSPVGSGVVRFTAASQQSGFEESAIWWRAAIHWVCIISMVIVPIMLMASEQVALWLLNDVNLSWLIVICVSLMPIVSFGTLCNSIINGQQLYKRYIGIGFVSTIISSTVMILCVIYGNIEGALFAAAIQYPLIAMVIITLNLKQPWLRLKYWYGEVDDKAKSSIFNYMLMALTSAITLPIALILIRKILSSELGWVYTGHWQAVWKISEAYLGVITLALGTYFLPRLSSKRNVNEVISEILNTAKLAIPVCIFLSVLVFIFRDTALTLLFTEEFSSARELFFIQLCGDVVKVASWLLAFTMLAKGATKWYVGSEIGFSIVFVTLTYTLVDVLKEQGVLFAYLISYTIYFLTIVLNIKKIIKQSHS